MKTRNNVQKTILIVIIILTGIAILNGSTSAQGFWKRVDDVDHNVLAMKTDLGSKTNSGLSHASNSFDFKNLIEVENESPLEVEEWMINDFGEEYETKIERTSERSKQLKETTVTKKQEEKVYSTSTFVYRNIDDPVLKFERWMFDPKHWSAK